MAHLEKIKLKSGIAHRVYYYQDGIQKKKYFGPKIPSKIVTIWKKEKEKELAFYNAGIGNLYEKTEAAKVTLSEFFDHFESERCSYVNRSTMNRYHLAWKNLMEIVSDIRLSAIKPDHIRQFIKNRKEKGLTNSGINRDLANLKVVFNFAVNEKYISESPVNNVSRLKETKKDFEALTDLEIKHFFRMLGKDEEIKLAFMIIRYTGCRRRSIARGKDWRRFLNWEDINFEQKTIKIIQKGGNSKVVPLHDELHAYLKKESMRRGQPTGPVISLHADTITHKFSKAYKKANIKKDLAPVHGLRHTAATKLIEAGCDLTVVADILGHENIKTTQRYVHPSMAHKHMQVNRL